MRASIRQSVFDNFLENRCRRSRPEKDIIIFVDT